MQIKTNSYNIQKIVSVILLLLLCHIFASYGARFVPVINGLYSDQYYYRLSYDGWKGVLYFERGYKVITHFFSELGLTYFQFKSIMAVMAAGLIASSIGVFDVNYIFVMGLYFFSSFQADLEQTRNFFAMAIVIFALRFLFKQPPAIKNAVVYIALILLATTIHTASLFFLVFLLSQEKQLYKILDYLFPVLLTISILLKTVPSVRIITGQVMYSFTHNDRILMWFSYTTGMGFYACAILHGLMLLLFWFITRQLARGGVECDKKRVFVEVSYRCLQLLSLAVPLYLFSTEFLRLYRSLFVVFFVALLEGAKLVDQKIETKDYTLICSASLLMFVLGYWIVFDPFNITSMYYTMAGLL